MAKLYGGRWRILDSLDEGGQADVFTVKDETEETERRYVLKRLKNIKRIERFKDEIEAVQKLDHNHIVELIDFNLESRRPYMVTEYCEGGNLARAESFWHSSPLIAFSIFQHICEGINFAHNNGIIHRDIKPSNIFLRSSKGPAVVGDFGICHIEKDGVRITLTEEAVGARYYMAPELEDGRIEEISEKSDVYSLGKVLYWLLSGGRVFSREKHREQKWDLKGWNVDSPLGWDNIYLEHVNWLLDFMITNKPEDRRSVRNILLVLKMVKKLVKKEYNPIGDNIPQPCYYCGKGIYIQVAKDWKTAANFGFDPQAGTKWKVLLCNECGHMQVFRKDDLGKFKTLK